MTASLILFQPDIAQNFGSILRLGACMGLPVHVIEPCGFPMDDRRVKRAGMDYVADVELVRHVSWEAYLEAREGRRKILMTTKGAQPLFPFEFTENDDILFGRESAGAPDEVHAAMDCRLLIPMPGQGRSLNLAMSAAMVASEVVRQTL